MLWFFLHIRMCIYEKNNGSNPHYSSWFHNYSCCTWHSQPHCCPNLPVEESPPWQSLLSVPVRVFWGGTWGGQGAEQTPRGLEFWGLWEGALNERQPTELGAKFPIWLQFWDQTVWHCLHQATHMAGLRYDLLQGLQKCCHPTKSFMKLTVVFSSVILRHNTGFCKGEAWVSHHGGHWGSSWEAPGKEKGKQGLVRSRRGQCLGDPWHEGIGPKLFTSQSN